MSAPIPLFVELCAGTAALSLRLHRDGARPPVSRMGAKTGYADVILRILGLMPGQRAAVYLWCEPDPGVRLLLHAYRDAGLAKAAAAIIRSWAAEDPRALWERLRAEGPPRLPDGAVEAGEVARHLLVSGWAAHGKDAEHYGGPGRCGDKTCALTIGGAARRADSLPSLPATIAPDARLIDPGEVARWAWVQRRSAHGKGDGYHGGNDTHKIDDDAPAAAVLDLPILPATIAPDARAVDPREVARAVITGQWAYRRGSPESGFAEARTGSGSGEGHGDTADMLAARWGAGVEVPAALIAPDARTLAPPALPPGTVAYMDPPYVNTTGYAHDLPRAEVVALARRWAVAGAIVAISEAEPISELVAEGWHAVRIDAERVGQKRTFSRQQAEWLTLSQPPAWVPAVQASLFGGAR